MIDVGKLRWEVWVVSFLSMTPGYDPRYLTRSVAMGAENYYLSAVAEHGEPPGYWSGRGAEALGFEPGSVVDGPTMEKLYSQFLDPRGPDFLNDAVPDDQKDRLGRRPSKFMSAEEILAKKLAGEPEATPERVEWLRIEAQKESRQAVIFHDATFSVTKSVSLLHAGLQASAIEAERRGDAVLAGKYRQAAQATEDAIKAGAAASVRYMCDNAGDARYGYHGVDVEGRTTGKWMAAGGWVVASFLQHTNRDGEPQLHVHQAILNRQLCADGKWRGLDGKALYRTRPAAAAVGDRVMREQLSRVLGVEWIQRVDGNGWELAGVAPEAMAEFSSRRVQITEDLKARIADYEAAHGHAPNARAIFKLSQDATKATKVAKKKGAETPTRGDELAEWEERTTRKEIQTLTAIPKQVLGRLTGSGKDRQWRADAQMDRVIAAALADAQQAKAQFSRYEVMRYISRHLPEHLGGLPAERVEAILEDLTTRALDSGHTDARLLNAPDVVDVPADLRRENGRSVYQAPTAERYTTTEQLDAEAALVAAGATPGAPLVAPEHAAAALAAADQEPRVADQQAGAGVVEQEGNAPAFLPLNPRVAAQLANLHPDQRAAITGMLGSSRHVDVLVGPAGAGKSYTVNRAADLWRMVRGTPVLGLTTSQNAAGVLAGEGLDEACNITRWLDQVDRGETALTPGQLVIVDEYSMVTTGHLTRIQQLAGRAGAKVVWCGDDQQLSAVGAGGAGRLVADRLGAHRLTTITRFEQAWEREASLRLRAGTIDVLSDYDRHGRLLDGRREEMGEAAYRAYLADHLAGRHALLLAPTTDQAAGLAGRVRADLISYGLVTPQVGTARLRDHNQASVGDLIVARANDQHVTIGADARELTNRDVLRVVDVDAQGGLRADLLDEQMRPCGQVRLDTEYVTASVELAYASTVHAAQGRTVDRAHAVVDESVTRQMLYVMLTRARQGNYAYVCTDSARRADLRTGPEQAAEHTAELLDAEAEQEGEQERAADRTSVLAGILGRDEATQSAIEAMGGEADRPRHMGHLSAMWVDVVREYTTRGYAARAAAAGVLTSADAQRLREDEAGDTLGRLLRQIEMSGRDAQQIFNTAAGERELTSADSIAQVLHHRITAAAADRGIDLARLSPCEEQITGTWTERTPDLGDAEITRFAHELATWQDARCGELGARVVEQPPAWLLDDLGAAPEASDQQEREQWTRRAGAVVAYREQYAISDPADAIGPRPSATNPEQLAAWLGAYDALGRAPEHRDVAGAPLGELWVLRAAYERETQWAPAYVRDELRQVTIEARERAAEAIRLRAAAAGTGDVTERAVWERQAAAHSTIAGGLERRRAALAEIDTAREAWFAATEPARVLALRADAELRRRPGVDAGRLPPLHESAGPRPPVTEAEPAVEEPTPVEGPVDGQLELDWTRAGDARQPALFDPHDPEETTPQQQAEAERREESADRQRLIEAHQAATAWYRDQLMGPPGASVRAYLTGRGLGHVLGSESLWQVGYAPNDWRGLHSHLRGQGYTDEELTAAGLVSRTKNGALIDAFRDRVMIPIRDQDGAVVAFTGRAAPGAAAGVPKYKNTRSTDLYDKSTVLFGVGEQADALAGGARPAVVEGPMDVLAIHGARRDGDPVPVAPCGTALTAEQIRTLGQVADPAAGAVVAFDPDAAGRKAAARAHGLFRGYGGPVYAPELPAGVDPADLADDPDRLRGLTAERGRLLVDTVVAERLDRWDLSTVEGRVEAIRDVAGAVDPQRPEEMTRGLVAITERLADADEHDRQTYLDALFPTVEEDDLAPAPPGPTAPAAGDDGAAGDPWGPARPAEADQPVAEPYRGWSWLRERWQLTEADRPVIEQPADRPAEVSDEQLTLDIAGGEQDRPVEPELATVLDRARHARQVAEQRAAGRTPDPAADAEERRRRDERERDAQRRTPAAGRQATEQIDQQRRDLEQRASERAYADLPPSVREVLRSSYVRQTKKSTEQNRDREQGRRRDEPHRKPPHHGRDRGGGGRSL